MPEAAGIHYREHGGGAPTSGRPPLILIHGAGGTLLHWPSEIRRMADGHVYSLDLPGHGKSPGAGEERIAEYARLIVAWMEALQIEKAILVGHSMGGAIAIMTSLRYPERVAGLVLVGTGGRLRVHPKILELAARDETYAQAVEIIGQWAFSPQASPELVALAGKRMIETPARITHGDFLACDVFDEMERLKEIQFPTLVICGRDDKMTPEKYSHYLAQEIPSATLELIAGAGHMVMLEKPGEVAGAIKAFLDETFGEEFQV